jgi:hypothetical protein
MLFKKNNNIFIVLIIFIFLIIIKQTSFFKNNYFILKNSYHERLLKAYDFCGYESLGFLDFIKKKYNIDYKIKIVNFGNSPSPNWFFNDLIGVENKERVIFLSYGSNRERFAHLYEVYDLKKYKVLENIESCYFAIKK